MPVVSVLWGLGLLTAISLSLLWNSSVSYGLARNSLNRALVEATVEASVNRAVAGLLDPRPEWRWRSDGVAQNLEFDGVPIKVSIQDELGKIDLNQVEPELLISLLQSADLDAASARELVDNVLDWRTAASLRHFDGAAPRDYGATGATYRKRNGPFQSVDELALVSGMTPGIFSQIAPALTVYSGRPLVDPQVAPREVLRALPGMTPDQVESVLAERQRRQPALTGLTGSALASLRGRAFTVHTEFVRLDRTYSYDVVVRLTENANQPYWVLDWRPAR